MTTSLNHMKASQEAIFRIPVCGFAYNLEKIDKIPRKLEELTEYLYFSLTSMFPAVPSFRHNGLHSKRVSVSSRKEKSEIWGPSSGVSFRGKQFSFSLLLYSSPPWPTPPPPLPEAIRLCGVGGSTLHSAVRFIFESS